MAIDLINRFTDKRMIPADHQSGIFCGAGMIEGISVYRCCLCIRAKIKIILP